MKAAYVLGAVTATAWFAGAFWPASQAGPWWTLWAYALTHVGGWHLIGNLVGLVSLSLGVARRVGQQRTLALYAICVPVAGLGHVLMTPEALAGASGGVMGLAGAYAVLYPKKRLWAWLVIAYAVASLFMGVLYLLPTVSHWAHLAGLACGVLMARRMR